MKPPPDDPFAAVFLIYLNTVSPAACDETTAADVFWPASGNELSRVMGWQDVAARSALANEVGRTACVKTLCRASAEAGRPAAPLQPGTGSTFTRLGAIGRRFSPSWRM
jgi:hypothetical protein